MESCFWQILGKQSSHAFKAGLYLNGGGAGARLQALRERLEFHEYVPMKHPTQFEVLYINNLSDSLYQKIVDFAKNSHGFVGHADCTYASMLKWYLSFDLPTQCLKYKGLILRDMPGDCAWGEVYDFHHFGFHALGWRLVSVPDYLFGPFLSYKIERPVLDGFEADSRYAAAALGSVDIRELPVRVSEEKLGYMRAKGERSARLLGDIGASNMADRIKGALSRSYIFDLEFDPQRDALIRFNTVLEMGSGANKRRLRVGLRIENGQVLPITGF
jgi:hypothetical protein